MKLIDLKKDDIEFNNKRLNRRKVIITMVIIILIIIVVIISAIYITNSNFRNLMDQYVFRKSVTENNLEYIDINSESNTYIYAYDKYLVTLEKNILTHYNSSAKKESEIKLEISEPIYASDGKYLMVAEKNKQRIYLVNNNGIIWQKDIEGTISKINVNKNGYTSVIISGTTYKSVIAVFDKDGKELFKTYLSSTIAMDSTISEDNKYLSFAEINTSGTLIQSSIKTISIDKAKETPSDSIIYTYDAEQNDLIVNMKYHDKNKLVCIYNNGIHVNNNNKDEILISLNEKDKKVAFSDIELANCAYRVIEKSTGLFKANSTIELYNTTTKKQNIYTFDGVAKRIYSYSNIIAIDLGSEVHFIGTNGWLMKKYSSTQEIKDIVMAENLAGIIYRDKIEFINL